MKETKEEGINMKIAKEVLKFVKQQAMEEHTVCGYWSACPETERLYREAIRLIGITTEASEGEINEILEQIFYEPEGEMEEPEKLCEKEQQGLIMSLAQTADRLESEEDRQLLQNFKQHIKDYYDAQSQSTEKEVAIA